MNNDFELLKEGIKYTFNPKNLKDELLSLNRNENILLSLMLLASIVSFIFGKDYSLVGWIGLVTSLATAISLILVDIGKITNYFWGTIGSIAWLIASVNNRLIGDISSQIFYTIMQFVGIYVWFKLMKKINSDTAPSRRISKLGALATFIGAIILYLLNVYIGYKLNGNQVLLDSTLLPLGIIGQVLMTFDYRSQWIAWITLDVINVYIWGVQLNNGGSAALSMFVLQIIMLANALYGTYKWYHEQQTL